MSEINDPNNPSHIAGNGPEQDYLSRYWADAPWSYISVKYNFQLHQMFYALHPDFVETAERREYLKDPTSIKIVHFSGAGKGKPWCRILEGDCQDLWPGRQHDEAYLQCFLEFYKGYMLWVMKDPESWETYAGSWDLDGIKLDEDGVIKR